MKLNLADLEAKANAATPGVREWKRDEMGVYVNELDGSGRCWVALIETDSGVYPPHGGDRDFIAAMDPHVTLALIRIAKAALDFVHANPMKEQEPFDRLEEALEVIE